MIAIGLLLKIVMWCRKWFKFKMLVLEAKVGCILLSELQEGPHLRFTRPRFYLNYRSLMANFSFWYIIPPLFGVVCGLLAFVRKRKHLLNSLLSLEFIVLNLFWLIVCVLQGWGCDLYFVLFFLTMAACEGALGLALLVSVVRRHGNDGFRGFNMLSC